MRRNLFRDVLRDTNSKKYSMTKVAAFTSLLLLIAAVVSAIVIMIIERDIDHILIGELIALLLTLLGYKNFRKNFRSLDSGNEPQKLPPNENGDLDSDLIVEDRDKDELG